MTPFDDEDEELWEEEEETSGSPSFSDDDDEDDLFADDDEDEGDWEDEDEDDDLNAIIELSDELAESGELRRSMRLWRKNIERFPEDPTAWFQLGRACFRVLEEESEHHDIWADDAELLGFYEEAAGALDEAVTIDEDHYESWNILGALYAIHGNWRSAIECWEKSLKILPGQKDATEDLKHARENLDAEST